MFRTTKNLNDGQRKVRMAGGVILLIVALYMQADIVRAVTIILAIYGMVTGMVGYCPLTELLMGSSKSRRSTTHHKKHRRR